MHDHQGPVRAQDRQVFLELVLVEEREFLNSGVQQEAFEPEDTGIVQPTQVLEVARDGPTPETHVDMALAKRRVTFDLESLDGAGRGHAVERHVDDGGDPTGRSRAGRRLETLPIGAPWLVDMDVCIYHARQQDLVIIELHGLLAREIGLQELNCRHHAVAYPDTTRYLPGQRDGSGSSNHQVVLGHAPRRPAQLPMLAR